jgi:hypothetical protein
MEAGTKGSRPKARFLLVCDEDRLRDVVRRVSSTSIERRSIRRRRGDTRPLLQGVNEGKLVW